MSHLCSLRTPFTLVIYPPLSPYLLDHRADLTFSWAEYALSESQPPCCFSLTWLCSPNYVSLFSTCIKLSSFLFNFKCNAPLKYIHVEPTSSSHFFFFWFINLILFFFFLHLSGSVFQLLSNNSSQWLHSCGAVGVAQSGSLSSPCPAGPRAERINRYIWKPHIPYHYLEIRRLCFSGLMTITVEPKAGVIWRDMIHILIVG